MNSAVELEYENKRDQSWKYINLRLKDFLKENIC